VLYPSRFFDDAPDKAIVLCPKTAAVPDLPEGVKVVRIGERSVDWQAALRHLSEVEDISTLLVEGGSNVNAQLLMMDLADELFLTIAPKIKLGAETPTYADGEALSRDQIQEYEILESHVHGDEVFLRYRRA
jgi:riboflavin biosynthesis pyrimidine reductase